MEAERMEHLERVVSSDDPDERNRHIYIARWLKEFFDRDGREAELRGAKEQMQQEASEMNGDGREGGSEYMEPDSGELDADN